MKTFKIAAFVGVSVLILFPLSAQDKPEVHDASVVELKKPKESLRECKNTAYQTQKNTQDGKLLTPEVPLKGDNPQERFYQEELERLLRIEIDNVRRATEDVNKKHDTLIKLFPQLKKYQEVTLEDVPGAWRNGEYVNSKRVLAIHFDDSGKMSCLVLDSNQRNIYQTNIWIRKIIRLYYPNVQTMEMESLSHNFQMLETLEHTSAEIQLKAMRLIFSNLRTALYSMDMLIASYYERQRKRNEWQVSM